MSGTTHEAELSAYRQLAQDVPEYPIGKAVALVGSMIEAGRAAAPVDPPKVKRRRRKRGGGNRFGPTTGMGVSELRLATVVRFVTENPGEHSTATVAEALGIARSSARLALTAAHKRQLVTLRVENGPGKGRPVYEAMPKPSLDEALLAGVREEEAVVA